MAPLTGRHQGETRSIASPRIVRRNAHHLRGQKIDRREGGALEREAHDAVDPFVRFHGTPNEEQILDDSPSREALRDQEHPGTRLFPEKRRKMSGHGPDIVCQ